MRLDLMGSAARVLTSGGGAWSGTPGSGVTVCTGRGGFCVNRLRLSSLFSHIVVTSSILWKTCNETNKSLLKNTKTHKLTLLIVWLGIVFYLIVLQSDITKTYFSYFSWKYFNNWKIWFLLTIFCIYPNGPFVCY